MRRSYISVTAAITAGAAGISLGIGISIYFTIHSGPVSISSILLYLSIPAGVAVIGGVVPIVWSQVRRRLLEVRIGGVEITFSEGKDDEPARSTRNLSKHAAEDLRLVEYKTKRDEAENELGPYLPANPRGAKRLINHERLYVQIAEDRGIFGGEPELTYRHLAKWVLIIEHWPRLGAALTRDPNKIETLESSTDIETLQQKLDLIAPNSRATDEMLTVLSKAIPLSPILARLVRFEPSVASTPSTNLDKSTAMPTRSRPARSPESGTISPAQPGISAQPRSTPPA
jgi:hypothetical protein